jgi:hypothetical protein
MSSIQKASREMSRGTIIDDGSDDPSLQKKVLMIVTEDLENAKMCRKQNQK